MELHRIALALALSVAVTLVSSSTAAFADSPDLRALCREVRELTPNVPEPHPCDRVDPFLGPIEPAGPIEDRYFEEGPWSVAVEPEFGCCDSAGNSYAVYRPRHLGVGHIRHSIITWGNGSGGKPEGVDFLLRHLASWGFAVVATREDRTGQGDEILDAARFLVAQNGDRSSVFFHKLAIDRVGAIGHSQGASGALNAMKKSGGLIKTAVVSHIPDNGCFSCGPPTPTGESGLDEVTWGSVFFVTGSNDPFVSSVPGNAWYYEELPDSIPKARAGLKGPTHNDITGQPGCVGAAFPCFNGVSGYLGYTTAWMMDRLQGDALARGAFVSDGTGEIFRNENWDNVAAANIEAPKGKKEPRRT